MPDRAALLAQAEQGALTALQAIQALKALPPQPVPETAPDRGLRAPAAFFDHMRSSAIMGPTLSQEEVTGCGAILDACADAAWPMSWTAYALATTYHETAATMQPIREYGRGRGREYGRAGGDGQIAYGRGYVQLTWPDNYTKMDERLGLGGRLIADYDLALDPEIAARIMITGMAEGLFTGKKLSDFLPADRAATREEFRLARPIINRRDKDALIAGYATVFQDALLAGEWT
jgi:hypothetical protein